MIHCPDCGSRVYSHGCVNCNEELYIFHEYIFPEGLGASEEFMTKVKEQEKKIKQNKQ